MNPQATFQRMMYRALLNVYNVRCYLDAVGIFSKDEVDDLVHLKNLFELLEENGLRLRTKKCSFLRFKVELLGNLEDKNGAHVDEQKVDKIANAEPPSSSKELHSVLG